MLLTVQMELELGDYTELVQIKVDVELEAHTELARLLSSAIYD